ncbi:monocyte to macrophage differentiation factor 2 isoform X1 [Crotalus tigris]|uniref:monocyte to macrophage differentiation factor 2 isoform X1 n=1 Tax=Crotalus tigris TaxID=88082 RepID=UPI00192F59DC|nr:monocyte to macrophage differentiation factor 2 isoform X1 [Crotalus tigris]XP_039216336.1 monocyte to macrophage differentiation factor 2 isoform X1 [Crotalus tigris]
MNHRVPANRRYQPTEYEHAANCATHAFWIVPSILGSSVLYLLSDNQWETISAWIYGFGLSGLFIVSTTFHTISWKKRHLRTVEHCLHMFDRMVIYFFIAASYAPWLNLRELGPWASHMRWIIWIMATGGTVYVFFFHERYKLVELFCYLVMGFSPALVILSMHWNSPLEAQPSVNQAGPCLASQLQGHQSSVLPCYEFLSAPFNQINLDSLKSLFVANSDFIFLSGDCFVLYNQGNEWVILIALAFCTNFS